jgi:IS1 family transposase
MRSIARVCDVSFNTVDKLLQDAGAVAAAYHDQNVRGLQTKRLQCDEIWSFCYAKQRNVADAKSAPVGAGDVWTWTAFDAESKMIVSWQVGDRDAESAYLLMEDVQGRVKTRMQLTTDGLAAYLSAVEGSLAPGSTTPNLCSITAAMVEASRQRSATAQLCALARPRAQCRALPTTSISARPTSNVRTSICGWGCAASLV